MMPEDKLNTGCVWVDAACEDIDLTVSCETVTDPDICGYQYGFRCIFDTTCKELTACSDYKENTDCDYIQASDTGAFTNACHWDGAKCVDFDPT
jgi:hypothetical protein